MHPLTRWMQIKQQQTKSEYHDHKGNAQQYFTNKQIKLDNQAKSSIEQKSNIFNGCVVYINGHTVPSGAVLKKQIVEHGGQICNFLGGKTYATHIIASNLNASKRDLFANYTVVVPSWVVDSVNAGYRLSVKKYNLFGQVNKVTCEIEEAEDKVENVLPTDLNSRVDKIEYILAQRKKGVDCLDPNFITNYFKNSRLHFMSSFKQKLRRRCHEFLANRPSMPGQLHPLKKTLLHVDFDSFFVSVALKKRPDLVNKPVCVGFGMPQSDIASCNYVARKHGVKNGMWFKTAKELCPEIVCLPYDFDEFEFCSMHLYDVLLNVNPLEITAISVDEAILDVSNRTEINELCLQIRKQVKNLTGIEVSIGVGPNVLLCKLALKLAKPANYKVVKYIDEVLNMPVGDLPGVGFQTVDKLAVLNCKTIKDLQSVPLIKLQSTLGDAIGNKLYGYALGTDNIDIKQLDQPLQSVGLDIGYGVRVINKEELFQFVAACSQELFNRLDQLDLEQSINATYTVKIRQRSSTANFITAKYMGHGQCDVHSRSQTIPSKFSLEQLQQTSRELVRELANISQLDPLDFRGLSLQIKIGARKEHNTLHNYFPLADSSVLATKSPTRSPKKVMYAVPPRVKRKRHTLTQMFSSTPSRHNININEIDMDVVKELPIDIQNEILNDIKRSSPTTKPKKEILEYSNPSFNGLHGAELRKTLKKWISSTLSPSLPDVKLVYDYLCDSVKGSRWCDALDLVEYLRHCCLVNGEYISEDWQLFVETVDKNMQFMGNTKRHRINR